MGIKRFSDLTKASVIQNSDKLLINDGNGTKYTTVEDLQEAIGGSGGGSGTPSEIDVDSALSSTSENPVENRAIYSALQGKANASHTHSSADITSLDASKLTGTIDIARLPAGALERVITVEDSTERYALTTNEVQLGDTVHEIDTDLLYLVKDTNNLDNSGGYIEYTASQASSVPWTGVTNKPDTYNPSAHTHSAADVTDLANATVARASVAAVAEAIAWDDVDDKPTEYAPSEHTHNINDITDISDASVSHADTASSVEWEDVDNKPSTYPPSAHTHTLSDITDYSGGSGGSTAEWDTVLLEANNWSNKTYSLESDYPSASYDILDFNYGPNTTTAQKNAIRQANCTGFNTTNVIVAKGVQPTIDISMAILVQEKS